MKVAVAGVGYVGLSLAVLLAQKNEVEAVDIIPEKVDMINDRKSSIQDEEIEEYLSKKINVSNPDIRQGQPGLWATMDADSAYKKAELVIVGAPTNYWFFQRA